MDATELDAILDAVVAKALANGATSEKDAAPRVFRAIYWLGVVYERDTTTLEALVNWSDAFCERVWGETFETMSDQLGTNWDPDLGFENEPRW